MWRVVGRIAGSALPQKPVKIGHLRIGPLANTKPLERPSCLSLEAAASETYFTSSAGDVRVASACYFWVECETESPDTALQQVSEYYAPLLQTSFSLRNEGTPYRLELLWIQRVGEKRRESIFSPRFRVRRWDPVEVSPADVKRLGKDYTTLESNPIARQAAQLLNAAVFQADTAGTPAQQDNALLSFFKVIEFIARNVGTAIKRPDNLEESQSKILLSLSDSLQSTQDVHKKIKAVKEAHCALERLEIRYLSLQIEATADTLGLPPAWKEAMTSFTKTRNQKLGHAGPMTPNATRISLLDEKSKYSALGLARTLLAAYIDNKMR